MTRRLIDRGWRGRYGYLTVVVGASVIILGSLLWVSRMSMNASATNSSINLLTGGWDAMPGVTPKTDGLHVSYVGQTIVAKDGVLSQAAPAVNTYGTYLRSPGDFTLHALLTDLHGEATIRLYDRPPVVQDEFRLEPKGLELSIAKNTVRVTGWDDGSAQVLDQQPPVETYEYAIPPSSSTSSVALSIVRTGNKLTVGTNGANLVTLSTSRLLGGRVWFGLDASGPGNSWTLSRLVAEGVLGTKMDSTQRTSRYSKSTSGIQPCASLTRPGFIVGVAASYVPAVTDSDYAGVLFGGDFGQITTENILKWQFVHPQPGVYDFNEADTLVDLAHTNSLSVHGHTLVFGEANPAWVRKLPVATTADKQRIKDIMVEHITQTVSHFKGRITSWDVVNEPLADYDTQAGLNGLRAHLWYRALGEAYIGEAFRAARAADPEAALYMNEFGLEMDDERWQTFLSLIKRLQSQNVPIDGIGFQAHVYEPGDEIDPTVLRQRIRTLAALGLTSRISEMDVHRENGALSQARQYADVFAVCLSEPRCVSWSSWGVSDRYNMSLDESSRLQYGRDFLWDSRMQPTQALQFVRDAAARK